MKRQRFFQNAGYVSLFGILGTIICFLVNAVCAFYLSSWGVIKDIHGNEILFTLKDVVIFGSVLSASDTVAAISVISEDEAPVMRGILLGEGVINDAVAIILFQSALRLDLNTLDAGTMGMYVVDIAYICVSSVLIGVLFGLISAAMTRKFRHFNNYPPIEVAMLFFVGYLGYLISFALDISGVISILTTAIMMGHYTWYNISEEAREVSKTVFHIVGQIIEAFIFTYIGLSTYEYYTHFSGYLFMFESSLVVMFARFSGIVLFPGLLKLVMKGFKLGWMELITIWFAGSIRGAIAFALILTVEDSANKYCPHRDVLKTSILGIVIFTTLVLGSIMPVMKGLVVKTIRKGYSDTSFVQTILHRSLRPSAQSNAPLLQGGEPGQPPAEPKPQPRPKRNTNFHQAWRYVDDRFIKRYLIRKEALEERKRKEANQAFKMERGVQTDMDALIP